MIGKAGRRKSKAAHGDLILGGAVVTFMRRSL